MSASAAIRRAAAARILKSTRIGGERDRWIALWNYLLATEIALGTIFLRSVPEDQLYVVLGDGRKVVPLPRRGGDRWHAYFHSCYGYTEREKVSRFIYDGIRSYALSYGERVELRRFAAYDQATQTAHISAYDGRYYKIAGADQITLEPQGTDNVFFADDDGGLPCEADIGNHGILLDRLTSPHFLDAKAAGITPEQQRMALTIWMFAVAFPDLLPTKPILLLEGEAGSGKTSIIKLLQLVLFGRHHPVNLRKDKEDDFGVILLRNPVALLDNQDTYLEWLPDALCAYVTGAGWEKRRLFTDDESVIIKPRAFISFTTRNPASFRRDDVVDRCIILRFGKRPTFVDEAVLEASFLDDRPRLLGEYLWHVGRIVNELRAGIEDGPATEGYRMAAFVSFSRVVGRVLGWAPKAVDELMAALQVARAAFLIEGDPLINLIEEWLKYTYNTKAGAAKPSNRGRLVNDFQLASELEHLASVSGMPWKESPRTLVQKLRASHIEAAFRIEQHVVGGHKTFRIWRRSDPALEIIDGGGLAGH